MTTTLGTSNIRGGPARQTRSNPMRHIKGAGSGVRHNSLISNTGLPLSASATASSLNPPANTNEPPGLYPAISHFADAIAALPRDFRRHTSLLKEVDGKAWAPEENLQQILQQCLADTTASSERFLAAAHSFPKSSTTDDIVISDANSVAGASIDNASLASARSTDTVSLQRRRQFHALRQNLMAVMVTMDEKNHVITKANEDVSRSIRRMEAIWPHISEEISEEARLGSLKHWAYTETNPVKKPPVPTTRREAAASLAILHESETAHRSESRREAMLARKQRATQHVDSDFDESRPAKKALANGKKKGTDTPVETAGLGITGVGTGKRKKPEKSAIGGVGMERSISSAMGGRAMSRENSQQENAKKRKASGAVTTVARKRYVVVIVIQDRPGHLTDSIPFRINASAQDSPKLASSPLAGSTGKEAYKRSPALSSVRPATGRGRQNSAQTLDTNRARPSSSTSHRNGNSNMSTATTAEANNISASAKTSSELKNTTKEIKTDKGDRSIDDGVPTEGSTNGDHPMREALLLQTSAGKQESNTSKAEAKLNDEPIARKVASPRVPPALLTSESALRGERLGRGKNSKTSTPVVGTFSEAETAEPNSASSTQQSNAISKPKRPARPRVKDHGLHDSLSPKGLPMKRSHKSSGSISSVVPHTIASLHRQKEDTEMTKSTTPSDVGGGKEEEDDEDNDAAEEDEERYCYCQGVSYGEMVACDKPDCPRQWFHLDCIGLKSVPKSAKWYCEECKEVLAKKGKVGSNGGNGNTK